MSATSLRRASTRWVLLAMVGLAAAAAIGGGVAGAASAPAAPAAPQTARWVKRSLRFTYLGFTTHYSCQGLRDQVRDVLLQLGARREGLNVYPVGCVRNLGVPEPAPSVWGTFYVLEPVAARGAAGTSGTTVRAHWQTVKVHLSRSSLERAAQCELLLQVDQKILPLFTVRRRHIVSNCIPHQLSLPGAALEAEVLVLDRPAGRGAPRAP